MDTHLHCAGQRLRCCGGSVPPRHRLCYTHTSAKQLSHLAYAAGRYADCVFIPQRWSAQRTGNKHNHSVGTSAGQGAAPPFSLLLHITATVAVCGINLIIFLGHFFTQTPQPTHILRLTWAIPSSIQIALTGQATAQSPQPRQPYLQAFGPP